MPRWFNVAGPCRADIHYMLPPTTRVPELLHLIEQQNYFVINAPRQVGKTTAISGLARERSRGVHSRSLLISEAPRVRSRRLIFS